MRLRLLAVGRRRDDYCSPQIAEYLKRSRTLLPIELLTYRDEAAMLRAASRPRVVLDERGHQWTSERLARYLDEQRQASRTTVDFLVGAADGFGDATRRDADLVLGLSRLTLPHRLVHLIVAEQLYRAGTILAGHPYHR
ncbi:MAG: 23S rRNA (pseudouridine(1915)-N(3))-methyltransferase RlmH [Myxococcales bacterium FL481]|nr:MAG: 23S rRNA (pseudouridine(1915)-N(3))-methyltransferase RlmH [Myxococcales bacterium FL481]